LFEAAMPERFSFVGRNRDRTNPVSARLFRFAGNPFGTYDQDEFCVHCGASLQPPADRTLMQKIATKVAYTIERVQQTFVAERPNWIHARFHKVAQRADGGGS
jgi:hypothetical protein